jgi:phage terminase large subunit
MDGIAGTILGCDIARFGGDDSVIAIRRGTAILPLISWNKRDLMDTTGRIVSIAREYEATAINVDVIGLGAGVVDRLAELKLPVVGINVSEAASNTEKYVNRRAEYFDALASRFRDGDIAIPPDDDLIAQLLSVRYKFDSRGRMLCESKEDARKRGVKSPDRAEAVMLAFAVPPSKHEVRFLRD